MSPWKKFNIIRMGYLIIIIVIAYITLSNDKFLLGIVLSIIVFIIIQVILHSIKCPNCGERLDGLDNIFSFPEEMYYFILPKKCRKCNKDLDSKF